MPALRICILISCIAGAIAAQTPATTPADQDLFPTPEILRPNVEFWEKIYTRISMTEGLVHDLDYPLVIYKKVSIGDREGRARSSYISSQEADVAVVLQNIMANPDSAKTDDEKQYIALLKQYVPRDQWAGAVDRIHFQLGQKERYLEGLQRSGAYIDTICTIFRQYGLPERICYLPHVESSFDINAGSRVGAQGMWQFMRGTGKLMGLSIGYLVDERRDPYLSTVAAAKLLRMNFDELQAWPLAITAYNHGLNGMKHAVETTGSRDIAVILQKYESRIFQFASRNFYACFLAASEIAQNPSPYFGEVKYAAPLPMRDLALDFYIRPNTICRQLGVAQDLLMALNPALRPVVFEQQKRIPAGTILRLPASLAGDPETMLAAIPDSLKSAEPDREQYYRVNRGDNLYAIASRVGVSAEAIALENGINRLHRIYAGQVLRVPSAAPATAAITAVAFAGAVAPAAIPQKIPAPKSSTTPTLITPPALASDTSRKIPPAASAPQPLYPPWMHVAPETTGVAAKPAPPAVAIAVPSAPARSLAARPQPQPAPRPVMDSLAEVLLSPAVPLADSSTATRPVLSNDFDADMYDLAITQGPDSATAEIRVSLDETVGHYADWLRMPAQRIRELNAMRGSDIIVGHRLRLPLASDKIEAFATARLEYHMSVEEDFYSRYAVTDIKTAVIKRGQNLWDLVNGEEMVPQWLFKKYNRDLDLDKMMPGTEVIIPMIEEIGATAVSMRVPPAQPKRTSAAIPANATPKRMLPQPVRLAP
jgi:membrane-bound lytic murein transglycosylase D